MKTNINNTGFVNMGKIKNFKAKTVINGNDTVINIDKTKQPKKNKGNGILSFFGSWSSILSLLFM